MHKILSGTAAIFLGAILFSGCASNQSCCDPAMPAKNCFTKLPANCDPKAVGELVSENLLNRPIYKINGHIVYPEVCMAFGALRFADGAGDKTLEQKLIDRYAFIITPEGSSSISTNRHVDFHVFGALPLEIYLLNGDTNYLALGLQKADEQWENPLPDGTARESRYWVDDCFMVGILQIQ